MVTSGLATEEDAPMTARPAAPRVLDALERAELKFDGLGWTEDAAALTALREALAEWIADKGAGSPQCTCSACLLARLLSPYSEEPPE